MYKQNILAFIIFCLSTSLCAETIWVGVTPWQKGQNSDDINRLYIPMMKYLTTKVGVEFKLKPMSSYEETIDQIVSGRIQLAMLSPTPYVKAKKKNHDISILVTELSWNHNKSVKNDSYRSHILVKKTRTELSGIESLKGKNIGFVSKESTSGYEVPFALFREKKLNPDTYFGKIFFLGSHPSVTDALAAGSIDAGATWDYNWQQAISKNGDIYRPIWTSDPIPNLCIVAHPSIPQATREKIRELLINIPSNFLEGLSSVGFVKRPDSFYDSIRKIEKE